MDDDALYCKVYVKGASDAAALRALVAQCTQGQVLRRNVLAPPLDIDVFDQGRHGPADADDHFVLWPTYLEVAATGQGESFGTYLTALARLLNALHARGMRVAASCSFEDALARARQAAKS